MFYKQKFILVFVIMNLLFVGNLHAQDNLKSREESSSKEGWERKEKRINLIFEKLNLSQEQRSLLKDNKSKTRESVKSLRSQIKSYRDAIRQELMKSELDMAKITEIQNQLKIVQAQMADVRLNSILEVRKILSPEQFAKFHELMDKEKSQSDHDSKDMKE